MWETLQCCPAYSDILFWIRVAMCWSRRRQTGVHDGAPLLCISCTRCLESAGNLLNLLNLPPRKSALQPVYRYVLAAAAVATALPAELWWRHVVMMWISCMEAPLSATITPSFSRRVVLTVQFAWRCSVWDNWWSVENLCGRCNGGSSQRNADKLNQTAAF